MSCVRILIVDDHEATRHGIRSVLSSKPDWLVCGEAVDGLDAIEKAASLQPDVVLMDISMPRMNGIEAARIIRRDLPKSKVVIVSQNDPAIVRVQAQEVGAAACVNKMDVVQHLIPTLSALISNSSSDESTGTNSWVAGNSEMAQRIRTKDWSGTSLGPLETWPQSLRIAVNLMLNSHHPMWVGWGVDMPFLYNDAYISVLGLAKHSSALGSPAREVWREIWDVCGPLAEKVFEKGEASFVDDVHFFMNRGDFLEETYVCFSYNPIYDESGKIAGLFCPNTDTSPKILNARRLRTLSELAAKALIERSTSAACASSFATLAKNPDDLPFALLYLLDSNDEHAVLEQSTGVSGDLHRVCPAQIDLNNPSEASQFWRMNQSLSNGQSEVIPLQQVGAVPLGPGGQRVAAAITLPVTLRGQDRPIGVLIAGISPARKLDSEYRTFYDLLAGQLATAIQNARAAEDDRKRADALAEIDRAKTVFFSNVSHEFRTPLTLMLGPVEDLLSRNHADLSPSAKYQLELVNRNGSRLMRLVNTLLDFSRIEAGRMEANYQPTDLSAFTADLASVFRSATDKAGLRLELDCPKLDESAYIDRDMWEKIVLNLISNAFKFTFEGEICVSLTRIGKSAELRVRDTGVGIPENELPHLFDRFQRVQNTRSRTHEGSGIGLALVQELVKLHGGTVSVESALGKGSTFTVRIPLGSSHLPAGSIGATPTLVSTAVGTSPFVEEAIRWLPDDERLEDIEASALSSERMAVRGSTASHPQGSSITRPHVLIADDNADMRQYLVHLLADRYEVSAVPNGVAALESARERVPDLLLSDIMMPEMDGLALLHEFRSDPRTSSVPIILLSARAGEEARIEGMERGADDYLIKPFSARELLARVQTHLELARVRRQAQETLRQQNAQFETLLNEAPLGVYLVDGDFKVRHINPPARLAFGDIPDLIGRDFDEVIHILWPKEYANEISNRFRRTLESGKPYFVPEHIENRADLGIQEIYEWQINRIPLPDGRNGVVCYFRDISRLVHTREAIAASQERLRLATEAAELGIWHWYLAEDRVTWENERPYEIFDRARENGAITAGEFREKICHPEDLQAFEQALSNTIQTGVRLFYQGRICRQDGSSEWIELTAQLEERGGKPWRLLGTVADITARKDIEERERQITAEAVAATAKFRAVFDQSSVFAGIMTLDGVIIDANRMCLEACGYRAEEVLGKPFWRTGWWRGSDEVQAKIRGGTELAARGVPYQEELPYLWADGTERLVELAIHPILDPHGHVIFLHPTGVDITGRKQAERTTGLLAAIVGSSDDAIISKNLGGVITSWNKSAERLFGYTAEEAIGQHIALIIPLERRGEEIGILKRIRRGERIDHFETVRIRKDGTTLDISITVSPIKDAAGNVVGASKVARDISERKRAEEDLRRSEEKLRTLAGELETQVLSRTRELEQRNAEILQQSDQLRELSRRLLQAQDEERRHIARELHDSAGQIVTGLAMIVSRIGQRSRQSVPLIAEDVSTCQQLVQQLSQEIRTTSYLLYPPLLDETGLREALRWYIHGLTERSGLEITLNVSEDFGRLPREVELVVYRLVQETLTNIHRHSGSKSAVIDLVRDGETLALEVRDAGRGIPAEKLSRMQMKGTGVGLRGMRERIRPFDGRMNIKSNDGGTTISFVFRLPAEIAPTPHELTQQIPAGG